MVFVFTDHILILMLFTFWLPAHIAHLVGFIIANVNDIYINWKIFAIGDIAGWGLLCGVTSLFVFLVDWPLWILWVYYGVHIILISTILTDACLFQESISVQSIKALVRETVIESLLIPWGAGLIAGIACFFIFGTYKA